MADNCVPLEEQETVIQFDRNSTICHVYTTDTTVMTKLDKVHKRVKQDYINGRPIAAYYEFDRRFVLFRSKIPVATEKQRSQARKNLSKSKKMR